MDMTTLLRTDLAYDPIDRRAGSEGGKVEAPVLRPGGQACRSPTRWRLRPWESRSRGRGGRQAALLEQNRHGMRGCPGLEAAARERRAHFLTDVRVPRAQSRFARTPPLELSPGHAPQPGMPHARLLRIPPLRNKDDERARVGGDLVVDSFFDQAPFLQDGIARVPHDGVVSLSSCVTGQCARHRVGRVRAGHGAD